MREEISLFNERIELNTIAIDMMENDLVNLRRIMQSNNKLI